MHYANRAKGFITPTNQNMHVLLCSGFIMLAGQATSEIAESGGGAERRFFRRQPFDVAGACRGCIASLVVFRLTSEARM